MSPDLLPLLAIATPFVLAVLGWMAWISKLVWEIKVVIATNHGPIIERLDDVEERTVRNEFRLDRLEGLFPTSAPRTHDAN